MDELIHTANKKQSHQKLRFDNEHCLELDIMVVVFAIEGESLNEQYLYHPQ